VTGPVSTVTTDGLAPVIGGGFDTGRPAITAFTHEMGTGPPNAVSAGRGWRGHSSCPVSNGPGVAAWTRVAGPGAIGSPPARLKGVPVVWEFDVNWVTYDDFWNSSFVVKFLGKVRMWFRANPREL